jgi:DNA-binding MarR family transcriptional regulator
MMTNYGSEELSVMLCRMVYLTYTRFKNGMDQAFSEQGLTMEQFLVLVNIKYNDVPMHIKNLADWLERSTNSMSMLVDRMVKAGLLRRVRDKRDRRAVNVSLTSKGEIAIERAGPAAWDEDKRTLANLFKMINYKLIEHLNPGADAEKMIERDIRERDYVMKHWHKQVQLTTPEVKRS